MESPSGLVGKRGFSHDWRGSWGDSGNARRCVALQKKSTDHFILQSHENLHLIRAGQKICVGCLPLGESKAAGFAIPGDRFVVDKFSIAIPQCGPLDVWKHLIIGEHRAHVIDRVAENSGGREVVEVRTILRELKRAKDRVGVGRHFAFEQGFDGRRDERCGSDGRSVRHGGCVRDGWGKRDGGR